MPLATPCCIKAILNALYVYVPGFGLPPRHGLAGRRRTFAEGAGATGRGRFSRGRERDATSLSRAHARVLEKVLKAVLKDGFKCARREKNQ